MYSAHVWISFSFGIRKGEIGEMELLLMLELLVLLLGGRWWSENKKQRLSAIGREGKHTSQDRSREENRLGGEGETD